MKNSADIFEERINKLEREVSIRLSGLLTANKGLQFVTEEDRKVNNLGDLLEFRNEITGNVFDFFPISILENCQIEAYNTEGEPLSGDPVAIKQLPLDSKISLIRLIENHEDAKTLN